MRGSGGETDDDGGGDVCGDGGTSEREGDSGSDDGGGGGGGGRLGGGIGGSLGFIHDRHQPRGPKANPEALRPNRALHCKGPDATSDYYRATRA